MRANYYVKTQLLLLQEVQRLVASVIPVTPTGGDKEGRSGLWLVATTYTEHEQLNPFFFLGKSFRWQQLQKCVGK